MYQVSIYGPQVINENKDLKLQCVVVYTLGNATGSETFVWQRDSQLLQTGIHSLSCH